MPRLPILILRPVHALALMFSALVALLILPAAAFAATATPAFAIDLAPIVDGVIFPVLQSVLLAAVSWAVYKVAAYAHFQVTDGQRAFLISAVDNAIAFAQQKLAGHETITAPQQVAEALNYLLPKVPGTLKALNVTPGHLQDIITARLPTAGNLFTAPGASQGAGAAPNAA